MKTRIIVLIAIIVGILSLTGTSVSAEPTRPAGDITAVTVGTDSSVGPQAYCPITKFGYSGYYMCGTLVLNVLWPNGVNETFIISPTRTIYHAWSGSGGWQLMPGNGRADNMVAAEWYYGDRTVVVWVNGYGNYCTTDPVGSGGWNGWWPC